MTQSDTYNATNIRMMISKNGNVGIGTSTPGALLDIGSSGSAGTIRITNNNHGDWVVQKRRSDDTQILGIKEANSDGSMAFLTTNTQRMVIDNSGDVGIGTTSPLVKTDILDVNKANSTNLTNLGVRTSDTATIDVGGSIGL